MEKQWKVGILLFNEVEVLDIAGPFEVFSITEYPDSKVKPFDVKTIAQSKNIIVARNGFQILPHYSFEDNPIFDILMIPGGYGAENIEIYNDRLIQWIQNQMKIVNVLASVCTGAFLLAKAGVLDGKKATTHWMDLERLAAEFTKIDVQKDKKFIDEGNIITSGGISAGINMSFYMIEKLIGKKIAQTTAKRMEYDIIL